jgi:peroxiredoxin
MRLYRQAKFRRVTDAPERWAIPFSGSDLENLMIAILFGTVLPWVLIAGGGWLGYQLVRQNGRILLRLDSIERQLRSRQGTQKREPGGLPVGTLAPDFELPDLGEVPRKLSEFRGRDLLLIFFNPNCGFCSKMADDLAALPIDGDDRHPLPVVVSTGDAEENRQFVERYGIRCPVLLQKQMEVATRYGAQGTPMGYRIDRAGRIASELTVGAEPLLQLADRNLSQIAKGNGSHKRRVDPSLAQSRLNREGLKAGTPAPEFRLPRIDEGELSLSELRGRSCLLVFSDPNCGPCDELAPHLEELHRERGDLQLLMVSRCDADATRAKAASLGLTFPIVMQKKWEISLKYGMFATPIGYLIDEQGIILRDVAVGVGPILALTRETSLPVAGDGEAAFVSEITI